MSSPAPSFRPALLLLALVLAGCDGPKGPPAVERRPFEHRFELRLGAATVAARVAVLDHEQQRGLMHVRELPADEGMLFVYAEPRRMSFWMRNTHVPLDIGFFDRDGVLREVRQLYPHVEDPVASASEEMLYALEMNQGWFARAGVRPGDRLDPDLLDRALRARGARGPAAR